MTEPVLDLLGVGQEGTEPAGEVVRHGRAVTGFWIPLLGVVAVIAVGWGIWAALTGSASEAVDPEIAPDTEPAVEPVDDEPESNSTDVDDADDPAGRDEMTVDRAETATTSEIGPEVGSDGPILGSDVGYDLLVSTTGRPAVVDLGSGNIHYAEGDRVEPVTVSGSWLVARSPSSSLDVLPLDDLEADPTRLLDDDQQIDFMDVLTRAETQPGRLWVWVYRRVDDGSSYGDLHLVDLASGSPIDHPLASEELPYASFYSDTKESLVTSPAGGVYTATGDGFQFVTEGRLLAADADRALVETCDEVLRCTRRWLDRDSWQPLDLVVPSRDEADMQVVLGTAWVFVTPFATPDSAELLNVETGQTVAVNPADPMGPDFGRPPAISPDGEWLAVPGEERGTIVIHRLATGETTEVAVDDAVASGPLFFIDERAD